MIFQILGGFLFIFKINYVSMCKDTHTDPLTILMENIWLSLTWLLNSSYAISGRRIVRIPMNSNPVIFSWETVMTCFLMTWTFNSHSFLILKMTRVEETETKQKIVIFSLHRKPQWKTASMKCFRNVPSLRRMCSISLDGTMISAIHQPQRNMVECFRPEDSVLQGLKWASKSIKRIIQLISLSVPSFIIINTAIFIFIKSIMSFSKFNNFSTFENKGCLYFSYFLNI